MEGGAGGGSEDGDVRAGVVDVVRLEAVALEVVLALILSIWIENHSQTQKHQAEEEKICRPWQDSNLQSPDSESDALSIRPQGRYWFNTIVFFT